MSYRKNNRKLSEVDAYIATFPQETQVALQQIRNAIRKAAPSAEEVISYGIPTYKLNGNLVHFAGYKSHIGFYPTPSGIEKFKKELEQYKGAKGSVQFPLHEKLPLTLVTRIVKFRVNGNNQKHEAKSSLRTCAKGHRYYKTSDCPTCPKCEQEKNPVEGVFAKLSAPARRALENAGITTLKKLSAYTKKEILNLHGIGPSSIPVLKKKLEDVGLSFSG